MKIVSLSCSALIFVLCNRFVFGFNLDTPPPHRQKQNTYRPKWRVIPHSLPRVFSFLHKHTNFTATVILFFSSSLLPSSR